MPHRLLSSRLAGDASRFLVAGLVNSGLTLAIYQALLFVAAPMVAYSLAWLAGLVFVACVYPDRVFSGGRKGPRDRAFVALSYGGVFLFGLAFLALLERAGVPARWSILAVMAATTAIGFLSSRLILRR